MGFFTSHWVLTFLIFAPMVAAVIALVVPNVTAKWVARHRGVVVTKVPLHRRVTAASASERAASPPQVPGVHSHNPNPPKPDPRGATVRQ